MDKRGDYKWEIVLSLILGLMVLALSLYFIFHEYFTEDDLDMEACRQSIQVRATLPEVRYKGLDIHSFKDDFPLKCKTMVKTINEDDVKEDRAGRIIAEAMAECWYIYDKGDFNAFPSKFFKSSACVPCARIHLTEDAKEYIKKKGIDINIRNSLDERMEDLDMSYYYYLQNYGKKFSAFNFGGGVPFNLSGDGFKVDDGKWIWQNAKLINRLNVGTFDAKMRSVNISLPESFKVDEGDLLINYGIVLIGESLIGDNKFGDYVPYLFYFQTGQGEPFKEVKNDFMVNVFSTLWESLNSLPYAIVGIFPEDDLKKIKESSVGFCDSWEGIPA